MRIAVTGRAGQIVLSMLERAPQGVQIVALGRPQLDLARPETIAPAIHASRPDIVVNAAAFTAVDLAESQEADAQLANGAAAGEVARTAAALGVPVLQLSTDYVFDGGLDRPYREDDPVGPISVYGRSKLAGESAVAAQNPNHVILRTAWVYSPFGRNFVRTMLRIGGERAEVSVVDDQIGNPTSALDIADGIHRVAANLLASPGDPNLCGVFHMTATGEASWAGLARAVFAHSLAAGGQCVTVKPIPTVAYPTPARRPANSRLDCGLLAARHQVMLPDWRPSLAACVRRLLTTQSAERAT